jgi:hypothetical protein
MTHDMTAAACITRAHCAHWVALTGARCQPSGALACCGSQGGSSSRKYSWPTRGAPSAAYAREPAAAACTSMPPAPPPLPGGPQEYLGKRKAEVEVAVGTEGGVTVQEVDTARAAAEAAARRAQESKETYAHAQREARDGRKVLAHPPVMVSQPGRAELWQVLPRGGMACV